MLGQIKSAGRVGYRAGASATALAIHEDSSAAYATPSGRRLGAAKVSPALVAAQAEEDGLQRFRHGTPVPSDYQLHEPGRLLGEGEMLGAMGAADADGESLGTDEAGEAKVSKVALAIALALGFVFLSQQGRKGSKKSWGF